MAAKIKQKLLGDCLTSPSSHFWLRASTSLSSFRIRPTSQGLPKRKTAYDLFWPRILKVIWGPWTTLDRSSTSSWSWVGSRGSALFSKTKVHIPMQFGYICVSLTWWGTWADSMPWVEQWHNKRCVQKGLIQRLYANWTLIMWLDSEKPTGKPF